MPDPTWAETEPAEHVPAKRKHECARADAEYAETYFDGRPERNPAWLHHPHPPSRCLVCCAAPITPLSDYGWYDFTIHDEDDEPEWCGCCWPCAKRIHDGEAEAA